MKGIKVLVVTVLLLAALPAVSFAEGFGVINVISVARASAATLANSLILTKSFVGGVALAGTVRCYNNFGNQTSTFNFLLASGTTTTATAVFLASVACPGIDPLSMIIHDSLFATLVGTEQILVWTAGTPSRVPARGALVPGTIEGYRTVKDWLTLLPENIGITNWILLHCPAGTQAAFLGLGDCTGGTGQTIVVDFLGNGLGTQIFSTNNIVAQKASAFNGAAVGGGAMIFIGPGGARRIEGISVLDNGTWQSGTYLQFAGFGL